MGIGFEEARVRFLLDGLSPERLTRIVDIGANPLSDAPYTRLLRMGGCDVWGFEPQQDAFDRLVESAGPNEHYLPYAVGNGETGQLRICQSSGLTSLLEPNRSLFDAMGRFHVGGKVVDRVEMQTRRLDDLDDLPEFDLLKIDIQGAELDVFENGKTALSSALAIVSEIAFSPLYENQPMADDQIRALRGQGFDFHKFGESHSFSFRSPEAQRMHIRRYRSQLIDVDAIFIRALFALDQKTEEQLQHLAILADAVFDSQDVAVAALAALARKGAISGEFIDEYLDLMPHVASRTVEA